MSISAQQAVNWMLSQVGIEESPLGSNQVKYNTQYYGRVVNGSAYAWCQAILWCLFQTLGAPQLFCGGNKSAYTVFVANWYHQQGKFFRSNPQVGDMVFFDWQGGHSLSGIDHVGMVVEVHTDGRITTVEGNVDNRVKKIKRTPEFIVGYARPDYEDIELLPVDSVGLNYIVKAGDTLWEIAQKNQTTVGELKKQNNLASDLIFIGQNLKLVFVANKHLGIISVRHCQKFLNTFTGNHLVEDGINGPATKKATVRAIQILLDTGLIHDGIWGSNTRAAWKNLQSGSRGDIVRTVQVRLICLNHSVGSTGADGDYGVNTTKTIKMFQKISGVPVDGITGKDTASKLFS